MKYKITLEKPSEGPLSLKINGDLNTSQFGKVVVIVESRWWWFGLYQVSVRSDVLEGRQ